MGMEGPQIPNADDKQGITRGDFLKKLAALGVVAAVTPVTELFSQNTQEKVARTHFEQTSEKFSNGEYVYELKNEAQERLGEFWPIHDIKLVTKQINPEVFTENLADMHETFLALGTAPDGMTTGPFGARIMQGKSLANGEPCGDGTVYNYGIVIVDEKGINFTHAKEHQNDFDDLYNGVKEKKGTMFFLPSIFRNGAYISSQNVVDKVLVRRNTPGAVQIGVVIFDSLVSYDKAREAVTGLDRQGKSETTHIYMLDGGGTWGQSSKEVNGQVKKIGTRNLEEVTNYLIFN